MGVIVIDKETIRALLYLPKYDDVNTYNLNGYLSDLDLQTMIIDFNALINKCKFSDKELLLMDKLKKDIKQVELTNELHITQSGISRKIDSIVDKIYKVSI